MQRLLHLLLLWAVSLLAQSQSHYQGNVSIETLRGIALPLLDIETAGSEEPTFDEAIAPSGCFGHSIKNATKVPARMVVTLAEDTLYDSGRYVADESGLTIKVRGNTSAYYAQTPYKLKLQKKADLLHRGNDDVYKDKHWVLLADLSPNTGIGFLLGRLMGLQWTPAWEFVNVRLNGQYRGLYILTEQVRRNPDCRLNVDKTTGYIIEHDAYWWNEPVWFATTAERKFTFKYPEDDEVTLAQVDYIRNEIDAFEQSIADGTYPQHIDVRSFAAWLLAHDILGTKDSKGANFYVTKFDDTSASPLRTACLWDFGGVMRTPGDWSLLHTDPYTVFPSLLESPNPAFAEAYRTLWNELSPTLFDEVEAWLSGFKGTPHLAAIERSRQLTLMVLDIFDASFSSYLSSSRSWFNERRTWLQTAIAEMDTPTAVARPTHENDDGAPTYDLSGRRIDSSSHGFQVRRGRVVFRF